MTTRDLTISSAIFDGEQVHLLWQVDDFVSACANEALAEMTHDIIGKKLQLPNEEKLLFSKMGLMSNFNGVNVSQTNTHIKLSCAAHIDWLVTSHGWKEDKQSKMLQRLWHCSRQQPSSKCVTKRDPWKELQNTKPLKRRTVSDAEHSQAK